MKAIKGKIEYCVDELYNLARYMVKRRKATLMMSRSDLDDLIQEMVYKMYRALAMRRYNYSKGVLPTTYLCTIANNEITAYLRKAHRKKRKVVRYVSDLHVVERLEYDKSRGRCVSS